MPFIVGHNYIIPFSSSAIVTDIPNPDSSRTRDTKVDFKQSIHISRTIVYTYLHFKLQDSIVSIKI